MRADFVDEHGRSAHPHRINEWPPKGEKQYLKRLFAIVDPKTPLKGNRLQAALNNGHDEIPSPHLCRCYALFKLADEYDHHGTKNKHVGKNCINRDRSAKGLNSHPLSMDGMDTTPQ